MSLIINDNIQPFFTIITATIGNKYLENLLKSINSQSFLFETPYTIEHIIAIDNSPENKIKINPILSDIKSHDKINRIIFDIPISSGSNGFLAYKIYSSLPQFANGKYIIFIDDDNEMDITHLMSFYSEIEKSNHDWLYSLRTIIDENSNITTIDDCESLGHLSPPFYNKNDRLIDMNCYCVSNNIAKKTAYILNTKANYDINDGDRIFAKTLMTQYPNFICTKKFTLQYRLTKNSKVDYKLFIKGKEYNYFTADLQQHSINEKNHYLQKPVLYIAHFDKNHTEFIIERYKNFRKIQKNDKTQNNPSVCFKQWQLNMFDWAFGEYQLISIFDNDYIPSGSICIFHICHLQTIPNKLFERKDIYRVITTIESPNVNHTKQWTNEWLEQNFNKILTYWKPLFQRNNLFQIKKYEYLPFIHRIDIYNKNDIDLIQNNNLNYSICIILNNRTFKGSYFIDSTQLQTLDYLRINYVYELSKVIKVYCYGNSWLQIKSQNIIPISTPHSHLDLDSTIDYYKKHIFALILENCDAIGYVSEKIYDAWMVGCIPIYYGNFDKTLFDYFENDGIPIKELFICAKTIGLQNIANYINSLTKEYILQLLNKIDKYKLKILEKVGIREYGAILQNTIQPQLNLQN